jgi:hypothetical protein
MIQVSWVINCVNLEQTYSVSETISVSIIGECGKFYKKITVLLPFIFFLVQVLDSFCWRNISTI